MDEDILSNPDTLTESETSNDSMDGDELEDKSFVSNSYEELETLEEVQKLPVKQSLENPAKNTEPVVEVEDTSDEKLKEVQVSKTNVETSETDIDSTKTDIATSKTDFKASKIDDQQEQMSQKSKDGSQLGDDEETGKEEKRREKMKALLSRYLEMKTKKEIEKALLNEKKIVAQWLYPFRGTYQKEWELEMKKLKVGFQRALDFKKAHIEAIQKERKLVELNYLWADSAHYRISEELFEFLNMRCDNLKKQYLEELEETKKYYLEKENEMINKCTKAEERAKVLAFMRKAVHDKTLQKTNETIERFKDESEFFKEKEIELIKQKHLTHVEMITKELQESVSPPEDKIEEIRALFLEWKTKYEGYLQLSEKNKNKLKCYGKEIPQLEAKVAAERKKLEDIRNQNKMAKQKRMEEVTKLQKEVRKYEKLDPSLRKMISDSEEVMVQLRERKSKLDKIRKLKILCDRLETENDKILPEINLLEPNEVKKIEENDCLPIIKELCSDNVEDHNLLHNLYRKISKVKLQNQFLLHNIENLKIDNKALKSDMKKYLYLISSRKWDKLPKEDYVVLYELPGKKSQKTHAVAETEKPNDLKANLKLLSDRFRTSNQELIRTLDKV